MERERGREGEDGGKGCHVELRVDDEPTTKPTPLSFLFLFSVSCSCGHNNKTVSVWVI